MILRLLDWLTDLLEENFRTVLICVCEILLNFVDVRHSACTSAYLGNKYDLLWLFL